MHKQASQEADIESLPFDPFEAYCQGVKSKQYVDLHFPQSLSASSDTYFASFTRLQRLGGISAHILRSAHGANVIRECLAAPMNVVAVGGGQHVASTVRKMYGMGGTPDSLRWHIGADACRAAFVTENDS